MSDEAWPYPKVAYGLTALAAAAMTVVAAVGGLAPGWLYRDNPLIIATFRGQDVVTLAVAVPLLVAGLFLERRGSRRGRLLWLGMLFSALYGYLVYAFGAAFNAFFLLYVAIVGLALYALLVSLPWIGLGRLGIDPGARTARLVGITYLLVVAVGLGVLWTGLSISSVFSGRVPAPILASGHPTGVVFVIDLVLIVPPMVIGAIGMIRRRPVAEALAIVMCISGTVYTLSLGAASVAVLRAGLGTGEELWLWSFLTLFGAVVTVLLLHAVPVRDASGALQAR